MKLCGNAVDLCPVALALAAGMWARALTSGATRLFERISRLAHLQ